MLNYQQLAFSLASVCVHLQHQGVPRSLSQLHVAQKGFIAPSCTEGRDSTTIIQPPWQAGSLRSLLLFCLVHDAHGCLMCPALLSLQ